MKRKTIVEASRKQGKLTNEAYAQRVLQGVKNDQVLMEAYRNLGVANLPNFMLARIQLASAELKTLGIVVGQPQHNNSLKLRFNLNSLNNLNNKKEEISNYPHPQT